MRERITALSQARFVIAGRLAGFAGLVPGVVEEAWFSITQQKPLYIAGGFGGAARAVSDLLLGMHRAEFSQAEARQAMTDYDAAVALYQQHGGDFHPMEQMGMHIAARAEVGLVSALNNGLDEAENRELMYCTDPQRIAWLVLTGLGRL